MVRRAWYTICMTSAPDLTISHRFCCKCQTLKPRAEFSKGRSREGLAVHCKVCNAAYHQERMKDPAFAQRNRDRKNAWYAANADYAKAREKTWRETHPIERARRRRAEYLANPEDAKVRVRKWKKDNPEKAKANGHRRRAREKDAPGSFTGEDIKNLMAGQKGKCACCKNGLGASYHVDHVVPLARGGSNDKRNLQLLCASCNCSKSARDPIEFMQSRGYLL